MKKILIFEPETNQAFAVAKYIKKYSDFYVVACTDRKIRFNKKYYDEIVYSQFLNVNIEEYMYVLPMGAHSSYSLVEHLKKLSYNNNIEFIDKNLIVFDKSKTLQIAQSFNIKIPKTFYKKEDIKNFPIFYKEDFENGGGVRGVAKFVDEIPKDSQLIYQEYIDTPSTYGIGFLAKDGEILTYTQHKEVISYPIDGGSSVVIEKFDDKRLFEYTKVLLKELNYSGWGLAEFKYCNKRDDFVFMEINAKFWASIEFMLKNNPEFLKLLLNIEYKKKSIEKMIFVNRFFLYSFKYMIKNIKYLFLNEKIVEHSLSYQIVRKFIPNKIVFFLKKIIK